MMKYSYSPHCNALLISLLGLFFVLGSQNATATTAPLEVKLTSSHQVASIGDTIELNVQFIQRKTGSLTKLTMPQLKGFKERGRTRSNSSSVRTINGRRTMENIYGFNITLQATQKGNFNLGPASAMLEGKKAKSNIVTIRVLGDDGVAEPIVPTLTDRPSAITEIEQYYRNKRLPRTLLHVDFDKKEAVVGEQITATISVYSLENLADVSRPEFPKLKNFLSESVDTPKRIVPQDAVLKGQNYQVYLIEKLALFPLEPGLQTLHKISLETNTSGGFFRRGKKIKLQSQPYQLNIQPLPKIDQPKRFSIHNVGQWQLSAEVDRRTTKLNEPITLKLVATGKGSASQLKLPEVTSNTSFRAFPPTFSENSSASSGRIIGMKTAEILIQPQQQGIMTLGPFQLNYFNPVTSRYEESRTQPIRIRVNEGLASGNNNKAQVPKETSLRPIALNLELTKSLNLQFSSTAYWFIFGGGWLLCFALALLALLIKQKQGTAIYAQQQKAKLSWQRLQQAQEAQDLASAMDILYEHVARFYGERIKSLTQSELPKYLIEQGCKDSVAEQLALWFEQVQAQRYAPQETVATSTLLKDALSLYQNLTPPSQKAEG